MSDNEVDGKLTDLANSISLMELRTRVTALRGKVIGGAELTQDEQDELAKLEALIRQHARG